MADCTPEAGKPGIKVGMPLREVTALCPDAVFIPPNPARDAGAFSRIVDALETFSPLVEPAESAGCCYLDLEGLGRHDATFEAAMERLLRLVPPVLRPRIGVAPGKFTAWAAARKAPPGGVRIIEPAEVVSFLTPLPTDWLRFERSPQAVRPARLTHARLIGGVPMSAVQARFGPEGRQGWNLASGRDETIVFPRE